MPKQTGGISKTQRILSIYHLLTHCEEVSMQELAGLLPGCKKTFLRDIALLRKTGLPIRYSVKRQAYVLAEGGCEEPEFPDSKSGTRYLEKIIRLIAIMDDIPYEDCDVWYAETLFWASKRTMQRDFAVLNSLGFCIKYERREWNSHDAGVDVPTGHYYCDRPNGAYSLMTFCGGR